MNPQPQKFSGYERVSAALHHKEPDHIPFDLGGTEVTGMNIHLYKKLRDSLGLPKIEPKISDIKQQLAWIDEDVQEILEVDVCNVPTDPPLNPGLEKPVTREGRYYTRTDEWGIQWSMPVENGHYFDMVKHPLGKAHTIADLEAFRWPDPADEGRFATIRERNDKIILQDKKASVIARDCAGIWEMALWTNGFEKFFMDMISEKEYAHAVMRKITDYKLALWEKALEKLGENVLIVSEADDLATQNGPLISPRLYKEMIHPYHKELYQFIHSKAKNEIFIFYHTCGSCKAFIPFLIEEGVNILNPVQVSAKDMGTAELKREFGKDLTFWGGGVDTQKILPFGTPDQVREEVKHRIDDLAKDGGFVFAAVHNVQSDVPVENFMAMWETLRQYGKY